MLQNGMAGACSGFRSSSGECMPILRLLDEEAPWFISDMRDCGRRSLRWFWDSEFYLSASRLVEPDNLAVECSHA